MSDETVDVTLRRFPKRTLRQLKLLAAIEGAGRSNCTVIEWAVTQFLKAHKPKRSVRSSPQPVASA